MRFKDVGHVYRSPSGGFLRAVADISLSAYAGEFISLVGPSGCGKSTLLRLAAGLIQPSDGRVTVLGKDPEAARRLRAVGVIFQDPGLVPWRTALGNVLLPGEVAGVDKRTRLANARVALETVGLSKFEDFLPMQLSGGMKQRTALARALMLRPRLLLLDEPFGALDHITCERIQVELASVWALSDLTVVLVTHDVNEGVFLSDYVVVLTEAPARIAGRVAVDRLRPRDDAFRSSVEFFDRCCEVRDLLKQSPNSVVDVTA